MIDFILLISCDDILYKKILIHICKRIQSINAILTRNRMSFQALHISDHCSKVW